MKRKLPIAKIVVFGAAAFYITSFGMALDAYLMELGFSGLSILYGSNVLLGACAGVLVLQDKLRKDAKQQSLKERIELVAEMNQHLRSVLTSFVLYGQQTGGAHAEVMSELLRRIEVNLADMFARLLFDRYLPQNVLKAAKSAVDSMGR